VVRTAVLSIILGCIAGQAMAQNPVPQMKYDSMRQRCNNTTDAISCKSAVGRVEAAQSAYDDASRRLSGVQAASKELSAVNEDFKKRFPTVWERRYFE